MTAGARASDGPGGIAGRSAVLAVLLGWVLPGLGHAYLGRRRRALLFGGILVFMFAFGLLLEGSLSRPLPGAWLSTLATLADLGNGPLYFVARLTGWGDGRSTAVTHEIGNAFHWSAGVMNMLLLLDAWDVAKGRK